MSSLKLRVRLALLVGFSLVASLVFGSPASAAEDQATCGGLPVTIYGAVQLAQDPQPSPSPAHYDGPVIVGTEGDDVILGTDGDEWILGLGGDDVICGLRGQDYITGGPGNDILRGGAGPDFISGSAGDDILRGGAGQDVLSVIISKTTAYPVALEDVDDLHAGTHPALVVTYDDVVDFGQGGGTYDIAGGSYFYELLPNPQGVPFVFSAWRGAGHWWY